jgi:DNA polymerase sigma
LKNLTLKQIERQDFVDSSIYELLRQLNPATQEIKWNIEIIANIREQIRVEFESHLKSFNEQLFYPYLEE